TRAATTRCGGCSPRWATMSKPCTAAGWAGWCLATCRKGNGACWTLPGARGSSPSDAGDGRPREAAGARRGARALPVVRLHPPAPPLVPQHPKGHDVALDDRVRIRERLDRPRHAVLAQEVQRRPGRAVGEVGDVVGIAAGEA